MTKPWLTFIGLGEDGRKGLSFDAVAALDQARLIVGGARHLALIGQTQAETMVWPSPIDAAFTRILAHRGQPVCVLASGDPFFMALARCWANIWPLMT